MVGYSGGSTDGTWGRTGFRASGVVFVLCGSCLVFAVCCLVFGFGFWVLGLGFWVFRLSGVRVEYLVSFGISGFGFRL